MQRIFIFISTVLLTCFMLTMLFQQRYQVNFSSYDAVDIIGADTIKQPIVRSLWLP